MKVKTLIKKLQQFNPEAEVRLNDYNGYPVLFANMRMNDKDVVWLDGEGDIDLGEEISARFENAAEEGMDELDFYMDLLEIGITVEKVREYMGDDTADHMQDFCKEHGLI